MSIKLMVTGRTKETNDYNKVKEKISLYLTN
jgi:hypothetical protein